ATPIQTHDVKRVLAYIDTNHRDCRIEFVGHGMLLVFGAPCQLPLLAGPEHGRTIPLADIAPFQTGPLGRVILSLGISIDGRSPTRYFAIGTPYRRCPDAARSSQCRPFATPHPADRCHRRDRRSSFPAWLRSCRSQNTAAPNALRDG